MARPKKNNADYFSHDANMRNNAKIKALRRKFGVNGYATWCMMLEYLTGCDFFEFEYDELSVELISGDFEIKPEDLKSIIDYMLTLKLLVKEDNKLFSPQLIKRFEGLLAKRKRDRNEVLANENPQIKENKNKINKSKHSHNCVLSYADLTKEIDDYDLTNEQIQERQDALRQKLISSKQWIADIAKLTRAKPGYILLMVEKFCDHINATGEYTHSLKDVQRHGAGWIKKELYPKSGYKY